MYLVFTRMPSESYHRQFKSLLYLCCAFLALINSLVCWFCTRILGLVLFQSCFLCSGFFMSLPHRWCLLTHDVGFFVCLLVWCFCLKKELRRKMTKQNDSILRQRNECWLENEHLEIWQTKIVYTACGREREKEREKGGNNPTYFEDFFRWRYSIFHLWCIIR